MKPGACFGRLQFFYSPIISFTIRSQPLTAPTSTSKLNASEPTYDHTAVMALVLESTVGALVARAEKMMQASAMTTPCSLETGLYLK